MRLEQLQAFLAIAETGSFQQAARKCGVTQSTISRQIQSLEENLGLPLFHRTAGATLTLGGERFFASCAENLPGVAQCHRGISGFVGWEAARTLRSGNSLSLCPLPTPSFTKILP